MIKIVAVGKIKEKFSKAQIEEFEKRLRPFTRLEMIEVADEIAPQTNSDAQNEQVKEKEGERLLSKIKDNEYVILLDLWGEMISSEKFAEKLEKLQTYQSRILLFAYSRRPWARKKHIPKSKLSMEKLFHLTFTQSNDTYFSFGTDISYILMILIRTVYHK